LEHVLVEVFGAFKQFDEVEVELVVLATEHPWLAEILEFRLRGPSHQTTLRNHPFHTLQLGCTLKLLVDLIDLEVDLIDLFPGRVNIIKEK
jgi:hypothetical protein